MKTGLSGSFVNTRHLSHTRLGNNPSIVNIRSLWGKERYADGPLYNGHIPKMKCISCDSQGIKQTCFLKGN